MNFVVKIELEGEFDSCSFKTFKYANKFIRSLSLTENGSYCKLWFKLTFNDNFTYKSSKVEVDEGFIQSCKSINYIKEWINMYYNFYSKPNMFRCFTQKELEEYKNLFENYCLDDCSNFRAIQDLIEQEKAFCFNYKQYKVFFKPVLQKDHHYTITIHDDLGEICSDPEINIESIIQQKESLNIEIL